MGSGITNPSHILRMLSRSLSRLYHGGGGARER